MTNKDIDNAVEVIKELKEKNKELCCIIEELKSELSVKENLLKIKNGLCVDAPCEDNLSFADKNFIAELEDRHQSDCITINQLHTTIDTLVDKLAKLRKQVGL